MANENVITIVGNLTDDPELRYTPQGVPVANVSVAVNKRFFNKDTNAWDEKLDGFFRCNIWREYAENIAESLKRGTRVMVTGRLISRSYEDKDGQTKWITEIEADEICPSLRWATAQVTKSNRSSGGGGQGAPPTPQAAQAGQDNSWGGGSSPASSAPPAADDVPF